MLDRQSVEDFIARSEASIASGPYDPMSGVEAQLREIAEAAKAQAEAAAQSASAAEKSAEAAEREAEAAAKRARRSLAVAIASLIATAVLGILQLRC